MYSHKICPKAELKDEYTEDEPIAFEAMAARYARATDMLVNKVLRSLYLVEYVDGGPSLTWQTMRKSAESQVRKT